ncbi:phosphate ABC transporter substrate-binding protein [Fluviicola sp.]|uniref:phosphate ABC transporter substrate-binding protein n=1 Tax=Fluviicola sp. TaxID=1917219 RepID=UPI0031D4695F
MLQKSNKRLRQAFGVNKWGLIDFPVRFSNTRISRLYFGDQRGCSRCFPHGWETDNSTISNRQRNWKKQRMKQWKL